MFVGEVMEFPCQHRDMGQPFGWATDCGIPPYFCAGVGSSFRYAAESVFLLFAMGSRVG
jgi:hypothetical protein